MVGLLCRYASRRNVWAALEVLQFLKGKGASASICSTTPLETPVDIRFDGDAKYVLSRPLSAFLNSVDTVLVAEDLGEEVIREAIDRRKRLVLLRCSGSTYPEEYCRRFDHVLCQSRADMRDCDALALSSAYLLPMAGCDSARSTSLAAAGRTLLVVDGKSAIKKAELRGLVASLSDTDELTVLKSRRVFSSGLRRTCAAAGAGVVESGAGPWQDIEYLIGRSAQVVFASREVDFRMIGLCAAKGVLPIVVNGCYQAAELVKLKLALKASPTYKAIADVLRCHPEGGINRGEFLTTSRDVWRIRSLQQATSLRKVFAKEIQING